MTVVTPEVLDVRGSARPALELSGISKSYGPVHANTDVSLVLEERSVHAVLGENGAGKSTLMKVLFGVERPDAGRIILNGEEHAFRSPRDAIDAGIGMVFQHFGLVEELTALDNISLGAEKSSLVGVRREIARQRIADLVANLGLEVPLDKKISDISIAQQQRVEILKALYRGARILILDEPTALLAPQERLSLFAAIKRLQSSGLSVLFITHKLDEAEHLADDVTVMRLGKVVARHRIGRVTQAQLVRDMVGDSTITVERPPREPGRAIIETRALAVRNPSGYDLKPTDLSVHRGEITGVVGIDGHGHQLLCQAIAGVRPPTSGMVVLDGRPQRQWSRKRAMSSRISYVPEDRLAAGVAKDQTIAENLLANRLNDRAFIRAGLLRKHAIAVHADSMISDFDIRCRDRNQAAARLSGGNVQKIVLAREISVLPELLVVCEPTRGLDIGAIANVHGHLSKAAQRGAGVLVQSSDLDEIISIADRIVIFREGQIAADLQNTADLDVEALGAIMLGTPTREGAEQ